MVYEVYVLNIFNLYTIYYIILNALNYRIANALNISYFIIFGVKNSTNFDEI